MKVIAFYLPQFHEIPENNIWWGKGFTEWDNVRRARPQFIGHHQPEVPLDDNYYDLSNPDVMKKQISLAKNYGVDGFCYYHYWFEGKLLLEKPIENMLDDKSLDMPFMICWANESWSRTWDGVENEILIKQNYSENEEEWRKHYDYLKKFFLDERYIKIDSKPVIIIYKPHLITNINKMIQVWNNWAKQDGLMGLYWGFQHHSTYDYISSVRQFQFGIEFEPFYTVHEMEKEGNVFPLYIKVLKKLGIIPAIFSYDKVWKRMINRKHHEEEGIVIAPGAFTAWDNTPRRGKHANVFYRSTPQKFKKYLLAKTENLGKNYLIDYLFINAWNEWAEGAHLEPDVKSKYAYLDAVFQAKKTINVDKYGTNEARGRY